MKKMMIMADNVFDDGFDGDYFALATLTFSCFMLSDFFMVTMSIVSISAVTATLLTVM
jgi:uncharacterized membrane protein